jgi:hypothetical protein
MKRNNAGRLDLGILSSSIQYRVPYSCNHCPNNLRQQIAYELELRF